MKKILLMIMTVMLPLASSVSYADYFSGQDSTPSSSATETVATAESGVWGAGVNTAATGAAHSNRLANVALLASPIVVNTVTQSTDTPAQFVARYQLTSLS